jgi:tellurite resistance protein TehA-like permease
VDGFCVDQNWIKTFFPGYFALVMATGILSLAWHFQGFESLAKGLFWFNLPAYLALWVITLIRLLKFRVDLFTDATSHARGSGFLTIVAATCVVGKQFAMLTPYISVAKCFWVAGVLLWFILIYTFFASITLHQPKPALEKTINGTWLLTVVSTESLCTLGTMVARTFQDPDSIFFICLIAYMLGAMFYIILITLILYRWIFRSMEANMLTPPYWINMGALAITTLAGARLLVVAGQSSILSAFQPFILGFTLFFWATASWWIPLLVIVGIWRHLCQKLPLTYDPQYWSLVFPLGMYSVATFAFAEVAHIDFLHQLPLTFAGLALLAWVVTLTGLAKEIIKSVRRCLC